MTRQFQLGMALLVGYVVLFTLLIFIRVASRNDPVEFVLKFIALCAPVFVIYQVLIAPARRPTFEFVSREFEPIVELSYRNHLKASVLPDKAVNLPIRRVEWRTQPHPSLFVNQVLVLELVVPKGDQVSEFHSRQADGGKILAAVYVLPDIPGDIHERNLMEHFPTIQAQLLSKT